LRRSGDLLGTPELYAKTAALAIERKNEVEPELQSMLEPDCAEAFRRSILRHIPREPLVRSAVAKEDLYGALACFWLVFVSCLPVSLPFFFFSNPHLALRTSNFLLIVLLFLVGQNGGGMRG
jgi:VIT1/CCC1 family predicted Fe2+/Mn2+ transporter